ncbi:MAG: helix-turn-helix transcriptional regulator [Parasphingopyxis sp.]|uniref:helix-turn-helix transcriptional regulator n=1 Tax=Parasphingopyxis sp. TaxID=1920299 RepID=UPI003FA074CA
MFTQFAHDLRAIRAKAGLTERDVSILLEIGKQEVAALETGAVPPSVEQLCKLSIIYGRSFTDLYQALMHKAREALFRNLPDLPEYVADEKASFNRDNTLKRLESELIAAIMKDHDGS